MNLCATSIRRGGVWNPYGGTRASIVRLATVLLALSLAGCSSKTTSIDRSPLRKSSSADQAFVFPPVGGPSIISVIEGKRSGGAYQEILLSTNAMTPGQNRFHVTVSENNAPLIDPYPRIVAQMRAALPGVRMARSPYYVQNRYGPFGYAIGHGRNRDLCLFGWQSIRAKASPMTNQGGVDIKLRLCEDGASEQKLLSVMYGYTVDVFMASSRWNPYGDPLPPAAELGKRGSDIYPTAQDGFANVSSPVPPEPSVRNTSTSPARVLQPPQPAIIAPQPTGPSVPAPPLESSNAMPNPARSAPPVPPPPVTEE